MNSKASLLSWSKYGGTRIHGGKNKLTLYHVSERGASKINFFRKTGWPTKGRRSDTTVRALRHWEGHPRENKEPHCSHILLTFQFWLVIISLGFNTNSILVFLSVNAQKRHKCLKSQYTFMEMIIPT